MPFKSQGHLATGVNLHNSVGLKGTYVTPNKKIHFHCTSHFLSMEDKDNSLCPPSGLALSNVNLPRGCFCGFLWTQPLWELSEGNLAPSLHWPLPLSLDFRESHRGSWDHRGCVAGQAGEDPQGHRPCMHPAPSAQAVSPCYAGRNRT